MNEHILTLLITVGIPVVSLTLIILKSMENRKERKMMKDKEMLNDEDIREIYYGLKDINRRLENLETILYEKEGNNR